MAFVVNLLTSVTLREKLYVGTGFFLLLYGSTGAPLKSPIKQALPRYGITRPQIQNRNGILGLGARFHACQATSPLPNGQRFRDQHQIFPHTLVIFGT